jgi:hypothetical protein
MDWKIDALLPLKTLIKGRMGGHTFPGRKDDAFLVSYPKSGNTWLRFLVANITSGGVPVDFSTIEQHVPDIYVCKRARLESYPKRQVFKSHECYRPSYERVVYLVRDPRDIAVSFWWYYRKTNYCAPDIDLPTFVHEFVNGNIKPQYGTWAQNVAPWSAAANHLPNVFLLKYEALKADTKDRLEAVCDHLKLNYEDGDIEAAVAASTFDRMAALEKQQSHLWATTKSTDASMPFIRGGASGNWKTDLASTEIELIEDRWGSLLDELGYVRS